MTRRIGRLLALASLVGASLMMAGCTSSQAGKAHALNSTALAGASAATALETTASDTSKAGATTPTSTKKPVAPSKTSAPTLKPTLAATLTLQPTPKPTPTPTPTPKPTPLDHAEVTSYEGGAHCASRTDTAGYVILTWTSKGGATDAWILHSSTATTGGDGKTDGGIGPFSPNGSKKLPFTCSENYDYFSIYVHGPTTKSGVILQVANNAV